MLYKAEFETRRKKSAETWADFGDDLRRLTDKAFPTVQLEAHEQLALSRYIDQLDPPQISFAVKQHRPKNLPEAVSSTIELESYLPKDQPARAVNETAFEPATTLTPRVIPVQAVSEHSLLQHLLDRIEKLEITRLQHETQMLQPRTQQRPLRQPRQQRGVPREITYYRCGMPGHYARGCTAGRNKTEQPLNHSAQSFSINKSTIYP